MSLPLQGKKLNSILSKLGLSSWADNNNNNNNIIIIIIIIIIMMMMMIIIIINIKLY